MSIADQQGFVMPENSPPSQKVGPSKHPNSEDPTVLPDPEAAAPKLFGTNDITSINPDPTPDWSQVTPLVDRLVATAAGHGGTFLVATVGSEDPETGTPLSAASLHVENDEHSRNRLLNAIKEVAIGGANRRSGYNCYIGIQLMKPGLTIEQKGTEDDVIGVLATVVDFDDKHAPATRYERLPLLPHAEVETSPGQFQCWYFFDRPYSVTEAKPVLTALARCIGSDHTQSCDHVFRMPGTLNWPTRKKIAKGRSAVPWRARWDMEPGCLGYDNAVTIEGMRAAIQAKYPNAFDPAAGDARRTDFDWDTPLKPGDARELRDGTIIAKLAVPADGDRSAIAYGVIRQLAERRYTPAQVRDKLAELYDSGEALGHYADHPKGFDAALDEDIKRAFTKPFEPEPAQAGVFYAYIDPTKPPAPPRREIKIAGGQLPAILDGAEQALIEQGVDLFQRGDMIVRPGDECAIKIRHDQTTKGKRLFEVSAIEIREHMTSAASFLQWMGAIRGTSASIARKRWRLAISRVRDAVTCGR
jgi:hypothetical protein